MMNREYVSDPSVICGAERFVFSEGTAKGVEAVRLYNGKLDLTVLVDRCMDIYRLSYQGKNISFLSKNGVVSPRLGETGAYAFANCFGGGFVYTCGLDNIGAPVERNGKQLVQHGSISYRPAENVHVVTEEIDGEYTVTLKGDIRFTALFGETLVMRRSIRLKYMGNDIELFDEIVNEGYADAEYMLMYHANIGYPMLDENAVLSVGSRDVKLLSAVGDVSKCLQFETPTPSRPEEVFLHTFAENELVKVTLKNTDLRMDMEFSSSDFPYMMEWKSMACGDYVVGLEPSTTPLIDRAYRTIHAGEHLTHRARWSFQ